MILVFDFDGTIHQTDIAYKKALEESLDELGLSIDDYDYRSFIGMAPVDVWDKVFKDDRDKSPYIRKNGDRIIKYMKESGRLYDGAEEVLEKLSKDYDMLILSKCRMAYMEAARKKFFLDRFFKGYLVGEDYDFLDKYKILRKEIRGDYIMIGDRREDIEAGSKNNMTSIFASYGFGESLEGEKATYKISSIRELLDIL